MTEIIPIDEHRKTILDWALEYASRNVRVFPISKKTKRPLIGNKELARKLGISEATVKGGFHMASAEEDFVRWMFDRREVGGIAMPTGEVNHVIVADLDLQKEPDRDGNAHQVLREYWDVFEDCHQVRTRNGGLHIYLSYEQGHRKKEMGANIEIQSDGAYVLLPGSPGYRVERLVLAEDWPEVPWEAAGDPSEVRDLNGAQPSQHILNMAKMMSKEEHWWDPCRDIVAAMVGQGFSDREILWWTMQWTFKGHDWRETYQQICAFIDTARAKGWGK